MADLRNAAQQALKALVARAKRGDGAPETVAALRAALAAPPAPSEARTDKECLPVAWRYRTDGSGEKWVLSHMSPTQVREWEDFTESSPLYTTPPDHREAMQMALWALLRGRPQIIGALVQQDQDDAIDALRAALGEQQ